MLQEFDVETADELLLVELSVGRPDGGVEDGPHRVFVDVGGRLGQLISEQVNEVLHQVALGHEQVLADMSAVLLQLVLGEEDVEKLLVCLLVRSLHPLFQLVYV